MKKLILLCSIIYCCLNVDAQTLQATPSTVVNGGTVTVKGVGESNTSYFYSIGGVTIDYTTASPNQGFSSYVSASNPVGGTLVLYNPGSTTPSQFKFKAVNTSSITLVATFKFAVILKNFNTGQQTNSTSSFTITIDPTPAPPNPPTVYYNNALGATFYKNNCSANFYGSPEYYSIPANSFSSTISVADANNQATTALNTNGQAYANSVGTCTAFTPTYIYTLSASQGFTATYQYRKKDGSIGKVQVNVGSSTTVCAQSGTVTGGPYSTANVPCNY